MGLFNGRRKEMIPMAKDGTMRGGRRQRSGPLPDSLVDKLQKGKPAKVMRFGLEDLQGGDNLEDLTDLDDLTDSDLPTADIPKPHAYLSAAQRDGKPLGADLVYYETMLWLKERGCDKLINPREVERYAEAVARYVQCSEAISQFGLLGKHPTTNAPMASPFVSIQEGYRKSIDAAWYNIFAVVKENSTTAYTGDPGADSMEMLLQLRRRR